MPARGQRSGLRLAVTDGTSHDQFGVVKGRSVGMAQCVAQFAAFVDRARRLGRRSGWGYRREKRTV